MDLREKIVLAYECGDGTWAEVAETFGVGRRTVARLLKLYYAGQSLAPLPHGGGYPATLNEKLLALVAKESRSPARRHARGTLGTFEKESQNRSASLDCVPRAAKARAAS